MNEDNDSGTLETTYVHSPVRQIGTVLATSSGSTASSGTFAYHFQDAIGSTRGLWDNSGDRLGKYDYTPFGGKYSEHAEDITRKFTGHDWDSETRLYYTAYRYYSPDSNRWLTRDPLGMVDGPNVYAYVMGNPVTMWDALGLAAIALPWQGGYGGGFGSGLSRLGRLGRGGGGALAGGAATGILIYWLAVEFQLYDLENGTRLSDIFAAMVASGLAMVVGGKSDPFADYTCSVGTRTTPDGGFTPRDPKSECFFGCAIKYPNGGVRFRGCQFWCAVVAIARGFGTLGD